MIGERLRQIRKSRGMNQEELAERSGYSRSSIINWETGKREPRPGDIERLSKALDVSMLELFTGLKVANKDTQITNDEYDHVTLLPIGLGTGKAMKYAYWGEVLDKARELAENGDAREISLVRPLLKQAYELLLLTPQENIDVEDNNSSRISAYNGSHSSYNGNNLTVAKA